jgi:prohibitin 1
MAQALQSLYKYAIPLAVGASFVQASMYDVKGGTRAVIFDRLSGVKDTVVNEGTHFLIPWLQKSIIYDVRTKPRNISTTTGSKDLQMVSLTLRVLHRPEVQQLPKIYQVCNQILNLFGITSNESRISAKTTTKESCLPSEMKSSSPSSPNSMPQN